MTRSTETTWATDLDAALVDANIPTLLMVLVQLTGDASWLAPRYRCARVRGLDDDETGGLDAETRREIVAAARVAILAWKAGHAPAAGPLPDDMLVRMLETSTGERLPAGYGPLVAAGVRPEPPPPAFARGELSAFRVAIVGAGIAGLCAAIRLQQAGIPFILFEKNPDLGGTWHENRYPGAGVDTPSHIYSFSFAKHDWSMHFALQAEIEAYFGGVADAFDVRRHMRFGTTVESATYDEERARWNVVTVAGNGVRATLDADVLIGAVGYLNVARIPRLDGIEDFEGPWFHTSRWPSDLDLRGKRVAVVGNGATAMQVVPEIAKSVEALTIFARSKQWIAPFARFRQSISAGARFLLRYVPSYQAWYRERLLWIFNDRIHSSLRIDPEWPHPQRSVNQQNDRHREFFTEYLRSELDARGDLVPEVLPDYPPFGKRMLLDNGWFRTLTRDNVRLVTSSAARVTRDAIVSASGETFPADVLVLATGFDAVNMLASFDLRGRDGVLVRDAWRRRGPEAYLGMTIPGFPNFFMLSGPNTGLGHGGSVVATIESHVSYVVDVIRQALTRCGGPFEIEVERDVCERYNAAVQDAHERMIWTHGGMSNWYRNAQGRVVVTTPFRNDENWNAVRRGNLADFRLRSVRGRDHQSPIDEPTHGSSRL